jgi:hypothetical protein
MSSAPPPRCFEEKPSIGPTGQPRSAREWEGSTAWCVCQWSNEVHAGALPPTGGSVPTAEPSRCMTDAVQNVDETMVMPMTTDEETTDDAIVKFAGMVTRCPPGEGTAPDAKEYGRAQFSCACGYRGTMPYTKLFKRLRRGRPMRLRCQRCGRVLR